MLENFQASNYTIKLIFKDGNNWEEFCRLYGDNIRPEVLENVERVMNCGDKDKLGYSAYVCPSCGERHVVAHTCKSRFCNSCGKVKNDNWLAEVGEKTLLNVPHKHLIFTIPSELWLLFPGNRHLLHLLFKAANEAVLSWADKQGFLPGTITVLHTFGAQLNFNCHIHMLYTLGGFKADTLEWQVMDYISVYSLKSQFKTLLLRYLRQEAAANKIIVPQYVKDQWLKVFGSTLFFDVQNQLYHMKWYLRIGETLENISKVAGYVMRYAKRPAISETRILYYNKTEDIVKFRFKDKTTGENKIVVISVMNFIGLLVRHIPQKGFHVINYGGIYANARKNKIFKIISDQLTALFGIARLLFNDAQSRAKTWRERISLTTGQDPLVCPRCGLEMELVQLAYRIRDGTMKIVVPY